MFNSKKSDLSTKFYFCVNEYKKLKKLQNVIQLEIHPEGTIQMPRSLILKC